MFSNVESELDLIYSNYQNLIKPLTSDYQLKKLGIFKIKQVVLLIVGNYIGEIIL